MVNILLVNVYIILYFVCKNFLFTVVVYRCDRIIPRVNNDSEGGCGDDITAAVQQRSHLYCWLQCVHPVFGDPTSSG